MSYFDSKLLRAAKALGARDWSHPKIIMLARHMAHAGATQDEIAAAVGWTVTPQAARKRLKKFNIVPAVKYARSHRGDLASLPPFTQIDYRNFRAGVVR